jgi:hypothetical protein
MPKLCHTARMTTSTTGTGPVTLTGTVAGHLSFNQAGLKDNDTIQYAILEGSNVEIGRGVYKIAGPTLTRIVLQSSNENSPLDLTGSAEVLISEILGGGSGSQVVTGAGAPTEGPGISVVGLRVGLGGDTVLLYHANGQPVAEYATPALAAADAVSGDTIYLPSRTYTDDIVLPPGVAMVGLSRERSILTGQITLGAGAVLSNACVLRSANDASALVGVAGPVSGTAYVLDCDISVVQAGAGSGYGVQTQGGDVVVRGGSCFGSTARFAASGTGGTLTVACARETVTALVVAGSPPAGWNLPGYDDSGWSAPGLGVNVTGVGSAEAVWLGAIGQRELFRQEFVTADTPIAAAVLTWDGDDQTNGVYVNGILVDSWLTWRKDDDHPARAVNVADHLRRNATNAIAIDQTDVSGGFFGVTWELVVTYASGGQVFVHATAGAPVAGEIPLSGDRSAWDALYRSFLHANDIDAATTAIHHSLGMGSTQASPGDHAHTELHVHIYQEDHSAECDGANNQFTLAGYYDPRSTRAWLNGLLQDPAGDYSEGGDNRTVTFAAAPLAGDSLVFAYIQGEAGVLPSPTGPYISLTGTETAVPLVIHVHTTASDGSLTPEQVVAAYAGDGIEALVITDHDLVTDQPAGIATALPGNECTTANGHVLSLGSGYTRGDTTTIQPILNGIAAAGGLSVLAHPRWTTGFSPETMAALTGYTGIEIYNHIVTSGSGGSDPFAQPGFDLGDWDYLLTNVRRNVWGFAGDDFHNLSDYRGHGQGRLRVFVAANTPENILAALAAGDFCAEVSNAGVTPGIPTITPLGVAVTCPGAVKIRFVGDNGALLQETAGNSGTYAFQAGDSYVRIEAVGAYTDPFDALDTVNLWGVDGGTWAAAGGILSNTAPVGTTAQLFLKKHLSGDFAAQYDLRLSGANVSDQQGGIVLPALAFDRGYYVRLAKAAGISANTFSIFKGIGSGVGTSPIVSSGFAPAMDTWYTVKVEYVASTGVLRAKIWATGEAEPETWQLAITDTDYQTGGAYFRARGLIDFDNLTITGFKTYYQPIAL